MRFVSLKESWQQEIQSLHRVRQRLVHNQTALMNQLRAILEENGIIMSLGHAALNKKVKEVLALSEQMMSETLKSLIQDLFTEYLETTKRIDHYDQKLKRIATTNEACKRLQTIPGVGPKIATAFIASIGDPSQFKNGRAVAAWLGVVPKQYSSGGKEVLRGITKRGDKHLRALIIHGTRSVISATKNKKRPLNDTMQKWIQKKTEEKHVNVAVVALANKNIRIMWALLMNSTNYQPKLAI